MQQLEAAAHDPVLCKELLRRLEKALDGREMRFMEVCGTHTVAIFQSGLRSLLPANVRHLSGPGCPVCVTHESDVAMLLDLADMPDIIIATFGDLLRVPGPEGRSLKHAAKSSIEVVYSPLAAVDLAAANPKKQIVFPGIGFETTAPAVAGAILAAHSRSINNFSVLSFHKLVPPVLHTLLGENTALADAFLLPGHVAMITGLAPFNFMAETYAKPAVVGGFEPADILLALCQMAEQLADRKAEVANAYPRAVDQNGNPRARQFLQEVFSTEDAYWRGMGLIPASGLAIRPQYAKFDAKSRFALKLPTVQPVPGCRCGDILRGALNPPDCPLFGKRCTPANPVGPCMVSTEGSCAAWYKYGDI